MSWQARGAGIPPGWACALLLALVLFFSSSPRPAAARNVLGPFSRFSSAIQTDKDQTAPIAGPSGELTSAVAPSLAQVKTDQLSGTVMIHPDQVQLCAAWSRSRQISLQVLWRLA